jgi:hypothetical protein
MSDLDFLQRSSPVQIVGGDETRSADVVLERGQNRLLVKSTTAPQVLGNLSFDYATNPLNNSIDLSVNGSVTNVDFFINSKPQDLIVSSLTFELYGGNVRQDRFMDLNSELANGILIEIKSEDNVFQFPAIRRTGELDSIFSVGEAGQYSIFSASSGTYVSAKFGLSNPFIIKETGSYPVDDYVRVRVRDNLSSIQRIRFISVGALDV